MDNENKNNSSEENTNGSDNNQQHGGNENNNTHDNNNNAPKTFTQSEVNTMMAREKHQGANSVYNSLGIDPKDTKTLDMVKAFVASQKTDEQKAQERQQQQAGALQAAERKALLAEAKAEAMVSGVQAQYVDDVVTLAMAKMDSEDGAELKTVLGELKTKYPVWFDKQDSEDDKTKKKDVGKKGTGSSVKTSSKDNNGESKNLGARLAAQRRGQNGKRKSLWSK